MGMDQVPSGGGGGGAASGGAPAAGGGGGGPAAAPKEEEKKEEPKGKLASAKSFGETFSLNVWPWLPQRNRTTTW